MTKPNTKKKQFPDTHEEISGNQEIVTRIENLESEIPKSKRLAVLASILAIVLGGGGVFGVIKWLYEGPKVDRQIKEIKLANDKMEFQAQLHKLEVESIKQEQYYLGTVSDKERIARKLASQLAARERSFREIIESLRKTMPQSFSFMEKMQNVIRESRLFEETMHSIANEGKTEQLLSNNVVILERMRTIRVPANHEVQIVAKGSNDHCIFVFGYLSLKATSLVNIERVGPRDRRVIIKLQNSEKATFRTPVKLDNLFIDLEMQTTKVLPKSESNPLAPGDLDPGTLQKVTTAPTRGLHAILSGLPKGFVLTISWHKLKNVASSEDEK